MGCGRGVEHAGRAARGRRIGERRRSGHPVPEPSSRIAAPNAAAEAAARVSHAGRRLASGIPVRLGTDASLRPGCRLKRILVVDDDRELRLLVTLTLQADARLEVVADCASAEEAVRLAGDLRPDLVVLDLELGGDVSGTQLAPLIRGVAPDARLLLFTSHDVDANARASGSVDRMLRKRHVTRLLSTVLELLELDDEPTPTP
jgi:CheY-like chemotaxis protein